MPGQLLAWHFRKVYNAVKQCAVECVPLGLPESDQAEAFGTVEPTR